ncbi:Biofilm growth-associated repressor [Jannaschia donghaensis]|uniref:Biofilm growth-associated repressor n=2 Tax=Jannaschia donghaensis TaxID=420998 RepID=A0A0M6YMW6_9RHOB|nr:Biofilm growth-associated repressor [Jannaschia donghaensis]
MAGNCHDIEIKQVVPSVPAATEMLVMSLPVFSADTTDEDLDRMVDNATAASNFLKAISHEGRLMILCHLASGEKSVTELERLLSARQAAISQQLARLRLEGLVQPRREGKTIFYSLTDDRAIRIMEVVYDLFCRPDEEGSRAP